MGTAVRSQSEKERTPPAACGRPAWRPLSGALNKYEIIIRDSVAVARRLGSAPGLAFLRQVKTWSAHSGCAFLAVQQRARGGRARGETDFPPHIQARGIAGDTGRRGPRWRQRPLVRDRPEPGCLHPLPGPGSALLDGERLGAPGRGACPYFGPQFKPSLLFPPSPPLPPAPSAS